MKKSIFSISSLCFFFGLAPALAAPSWIWSSQSPKDNDKVTFRTSFEIPSGGVSMAKLEFTCDNGAVALLNGKRVATNEDWQRAAKKDLTDLVKIGKNVLTIKGQNKGGAAGMVARLSLKQKDGKTSWVESGASWEMQAEGASDWKPAVVVGKYGDQPWGKALDGAGSSAPGPMADVVETLPGFTAEKLYTVPKGEQGSWVAMTVDSKGDLITGDQYGGLYRVVLPKGEGEVEVVKLDAKVEGAHGLCYVYGALYVLKNEQQGARGLYRLRDTNNDGQFDEEKLLREFHGGGEHGLHSIIPSPDGKSLHLVFGNHTDEPKELDASRPARAWKEDHLLPRMWDANGHARGKLAPGGFVLKTDADAKKIEMICYGFRNPFDAAFDQNGELFVYDADMEWDLGSPWYRPTRVYHGVSGLDVGWRSGTGKWPVHYPDTLPPTADIGPGSPTGVVMGTGAKFPAKYQRAVFINDWTYGTMYAVHPKASGGGYESEVEEFVSGRPLPLTDVIIHPKDGAMYFMIGGRRTQSALYRVSYTGKESTAPVKALPLTAEAKIRRQLERFHEAETGSGAIAEVWPYLGHPDRHIRYAARVGIERQPASAWAEKAFSASDSWALIEGMVALARVGDQSHQTGIFKALGKLDPKRLDRDQLLAWIRAHALAFTRMGEHPDKGALIQRFRPLFPSGDNMVDRDLVEMLIYLEDPMVVAKTLQLMATAKDDHKALIGEGVLSRNDGYAKAARAAHSSRPNLQQYSFLFLLRNAKTGWTPELRKTYFSWYPRANEWQGGNSLKKFIENIRQDALARVAPENERAALDQLSKTPAKAMANVKGPEGPGRSWTVEDAVKELETRKTGRNFARGKELFAATACASCHRMAGEGGGIGPDLTGSGNRYSLADLLENIVEPSKVISDQYGSETITKKDGSIVIGRLGGETDQAIAVMTNPFAPESLIEIPRSEIAGREALAISMMPPGLINTLNPDELADLVAYLMSGGNSEDKVFK